MSNSDVVNSITETVRSFLTAVADRIENNIENNVRVGSSKLGAELATQHGLSEPLGIALASRYVRSHPDLDSKQGQGGGIYRPSLGTPTAAASSGTKAPRKARVRTVKPTPIVPGVNDAASLSSRSASSNTEVGDDDVDMDDDMDLDA